MVVTPSVTIVGVDTNLRRTTTYTPVDPLRPPSVSCPLGWFLVIYFLFLLDVDTGPLGEVGGYSPLRPS